jgi:hypothetical protein
LRRRRLNIPTAAFAQARLRLPLGALETSIAVDASQTTVGVAIFR